MQSAISPIRTCPSFNKTLNDLIEHEEHFRVPVALDLLIVPTHLPPLRGLAPPNLLLFGQRCFRLVSTTVTSGLVGGTGTASAALFAES